MVLYRYLGYLNHCHYFIGKDQPKSPLKNILDIYEILIENTIAYKGDICVLYVNGLLSIAHHEIFSWENKEDLLLPNEYNMVKDMIDLLNSGQEHASYIELSGDQYKLYKKEKIEQETYDISPRFIIKGSTKKKFPVLADIQGQKSVDELFRT